jgi:tetratricopeptide (TPR) repeat protein
MYDQSEELYEEAESLYRKSLAIKREVRPVSSYSYVFYYYFLKQLGEDHPDIAILLVNLADLFKKQTMYGKAEPLYRESLAIRCKVCIIHLIVSYFDYVNTRCLERSTLKWQIR